MALKYIDSMGDHYNGYLGGPDGGGTESDATLKWTSTFGLITREAGLHGYAMRGGFIKGMLFGSTTLIMEMYINGGHVLFGIGDTDNTTQIHCDVNNVGGIEVSRYGSNPATDRIFQSVPDLIRDNTWYHFGWRVHVHPSAGSVEVRLNGDTICNITGIKTTATGGLPWTGAIGRFTLGDNAGACRFDDLVVMDDVDDGINDPRLPGGGGFDKFIGPVEIKVKRPSGPGLLTEWTPTPAVPNHQNVDDIDPDYDATRNNATAAQVGAADLFAMEDLLAGEDVVAVQSLVLARKTEEGIAAIATLTHDSGVTTAGPTVYLPNSYSYIHQVEPTLPGGTPWTAARWNAIQYGYKRIE